MNKKKLIIIISIAGFLVLVLASFLFFRPSDTTKTGGQGILSFFFPTSKNKPNATTTPSINTPLGTTPIQQGEVQGSAILTQLTQNAVVGTMFNEKTQKVQYFEKSTGHFFDIDPIGTNKNQRTITTIPKIFEASWSKDGDKAILKYFNEINENSPEAARTFLAYSLSATTTSGAFLPSTTFGAVASPFEDKVFYLLGTSQATGIIASFENKNPKEIFSSPFTEFLITWPQKDAIVFLTKPTSITDGYLYKLNPQTAVFTKVMKEVRGLTVLYPTVGNKIIYSQSEGKTFSAKIYDLTTKESLPLNPTTLPEKCVFGLLNTEVLYCGVPQNAPAANYPDDWYSGTIAFSDSLWKIDLKNGSTTELLKNSEFDAVNLFLSKTENYLFFQNKKDGTLWSLQINK